MRSSLAPIAQLQHECLVATIAQASQPSYGENERRFPRPALSKSKIV